MFIKKRGHLTLPASSVPKKEKVNMVIKRELSCYPAFCEGKVSSFKSANPIIKVS